MTLTSFFFFNDPATTEIYTLSLHDALPISFRAGPGVRIVLGAARAREDRIAAERSEEHTSELQSLRHLVCRLLLEKKKNTESTQQTRGTRSKAHRGDCVMTASGCSSRRNCA